MIERVTDCANCGRTIPEDPNDEAPLCDDCAEDPELGAAIANSGDYGPSADPEP